MSGDPLITPPGAIAQQWIWRIAMALLVALALAAIVATIAAHRIEAETARQVAEAPSPAAGEAEARAVAAAFGQPRLATTLADLARHLPSATPIAAAARTRDGALRIALDAADPDELRASLAADPWFEDFRERGQEERAEGRIRVTLVEAQP
jgi:flagellar motor protein MotB